jgi:two-component system chemotaxis response regulator CheB
MGSTALKILVVDDSALMRNLVSRMIESAPDMEVVGKAMNGKFALNKIDSLSPDVIILDLEMPEMNGVEFLAEKKARDNDIPVIVLSAVAKKGASITMDALNQGAVDFIMKPSGGSTDVRDVASHLIDLVRSYGNRHRTLHGLAPAGLKEENKQAKANATFERLKALEKPVRAPQAVPQENKAGRLELIALGISTGGPNALREVFSKLDPDFKTPIIVVQHMPAGFTYEFAKSLNRNCHMEVKEAAEGDLIKQGRILISPGDYHVTVEKRSLGSVVHLDVGPPENGHRPSASVLFRSVGSVYGRNAMGIIMTGMGKDGADSIGDIYKEGGVTLGQDAKSSVVYGMPRVAYENGYIKEQVALENMAERMSALERDLTKD